MRDWSLKARFSFRSLPEVTEAVSIVYSKLKSRRPGIAGRISREVVYNAIFLHFASLPLEEQLAIYDAGLARLVPLLDGPDPDAGVIAGGDSPPVQDDPPPPAALARKRRD